MNTALDAIQADFEHIERCAGQARDFRDEKHIALPCPSDQIAQQQCAPIGLSVGSPATSALQDKAQCSEVTDHCTSCHFPALAQVNRFEWIWPGQGVVACPLRMDCAKLCRRFKSSSFKPEKLMLNTPFSGTILSVPL